MSITFAVRGDSFTPRRNSGIGTHQFFRDSATVPVITADAGAIGGNLLDMNGSTARTAITYHGNLNFPGSNAFSILTRVKANFTGNPSARYGLFYFDIGLQNRAFYLQHQTSGLLTVLLGTFDNQVAVNESSSSGLSPTSGQYYDIVLVCSDLSDDSGTLDLYIDGVLHHQYNIAANSGYPEPYWSTLYWGYDPTKARFRYDFNEIIIWDEAIDPTSITLSDDSTGSLNGNSRTLFVKTTPLDAQGQSDPGVANVKTGTNYISSGVTLTGTLLSTDPVSTNVAAGVDYVINNVTATGSAVLLTPGAGASETLDINNIKEQLQVILSNANTTTSTPVDLSANLVGDRIQTIAKYNPDKLPTQSTLYPLVTIWLDEKSIDSATIARNQRTGKRKAELDFKVTGLVFNPNISVEDEDPADEDINYLMENIELTLRAFPKLGGNGVVTSKPEGVTYYRDFLDTEQVHVRAGVLDLKVTAYY